MSDVLAAGVCGWGVGGREGRRRRREGEGEREVNMVSENFVSFVWKKYFHYYILPEWKN